MKFAAFLAVLAAAFGVAIAAGSAIGPEPTSNTASATHGDATEKETHGGGGGEHGAEGGADADAPHGLATAEAGLRLVVATPELRAQRVGMLRFRVVDADDEPIRAFEPEQTKRMHAIVVRRDMTGFQHVHPRMRRDGTWWIPLRIDAPGSYRLYADFQLEGEKQTLASDLRVDGNADLRPLPAPAARALSDGGDTVRLDAGQPSAGEEKTLRLAIERRGEPVAIDPYLGAGGHLVALREGDLAYLHVHPVESELKAGRVAFAATFPSAGRYRLFLQYRVGAQVRTVAFTLEVTP